MGIPPSAAPLSFPRQAAPLGQQTPPGKLSISSSPLFAAAPSPSLLPPPPLSSPSCPSCSAHLPAPAPLSRPVVSHGAAGGAGWSVTALDRGASFSLWAASLTLRDSFLMIGSRFSSSSLCRAFSSSAAAAAFAYVPKHKQVS